jgi:hypothetical protein
MFLHFPYYGIYRLFGKCQVVANNTGPYQVETPFSNNNRFSILRKIEVSGNCLATQQPMAQALPEHPSHVEGCPRQRAVRRLGPPMLRCGCLNADNHGVD